MRLALPLICLPALTFLAGCLGNPAQPTDVAVSRNGIEVAMSNRQTCIGPAPTAGGSWQGVLQGCDSPYSYRVILDDRRNFVRIGLEEIVGALGLELAPVAQVEIDGPTRNTWTFASPEPIPDD